MTRSTIFAFAYLGALMFVASTFEAPSIDSAYEDALQPPAATAPVSCGPIPEDVATVAPEACGTHEASVAQESGGPGP